jgi:hypothetical protein
MTVMRSSSLIATSQFVSPSQLPNGSLDIACTGAKYNLRTFAHKPPHSPDYQSLSFPNTCNLRNLWAKHNFFARKQPSHCPLVRVAAPTLL